MDCLLRRLSTARDHVDIPLGETRIATYNPHPIKVYTVRKGVWNRLQTLARYMGSWANGLCCWRMIWRLLRLNTTKIMKVADGMSQLPD